MRKNLFCLTPQFRASFITLAFLFLLANTAKSQCGTSPFAGPGGPYNPTTTWQTTTAPGSGTYQTFNIVTGNIYSFNLTSPTTSLGYDWDMTLSSGSAIISYDNTNTPIPNSYSGGIACPNTTRPASAVYDATYSGTVVVNLNTYNAGCNAYVSGQGSATLQYRECVPSSDPGPGLGGVWNVDAFATTAISIPNFKARWGYYADNISNLNFNTTNYWAADSVPSEAPGWVGCPVSYENFTVRARRRGFPCGLYQIHVINADDSSAVYLNGNQIFAAGCCVNADTIIGVSAGYVLSTNDVAEIRLTGVCGSNSMQVDFEPVTLSAVNGGTITDTTNSTYACSGDPLGVFVSTVNASGGASGFNNGGTLTYQWQLSNNGGGTYFNIAGATSASWTSSASDTVPAGATYVVRRVATDQCGNIGYSNLITLIGVVSPNGSLTPASQTICPGSTANLTVNFTSGLAPYNIVYTDGNGNNYSANNLNSGDVVTVTPIASSTTYSFKSITDAHGCATTTGFNGSAVVFIEQPLTITAVNVVPVSCNGGSNGSITVFTSGGVAPLSYSDGGTPQSSSTLSGLATGNYNISVSDNIGCSATYVSNPVNVSQPSPIGESLTETDASCSNVNNGCINVTASGGVSPYQYAVNGGPPQHSNSLCGLPAGTYSADVIDNNGCIDSMSITINNSYTVGLVVDSSSNESCYGSGDGSLTVHLVGGTPPVTYSTNGVTYQSSGTFTGLVSGTYTVIGKDVKGCTEFATVNITQPNQLSVVLDSVKASTCTSVANGAIYISVTGGTGADTYQWSNGETSQNDTALTGGTYSVVVTDSKGCTAANSAIVNQAYPLSLNIALFSAPLCHNDSTGTILATANGGIPPYNYAWNNGESTQDIDSIPSGSYTLTVTDASGCQSTISQTLNNPTALMDMVSETDVACFGTNTGTASVSVSGGTPPYIYEWSNFQTTSSISGLAGGNYYIQITDHNGCQKHDSVLVAQPANPLTVSLASTDVSCFNANDGTITATVTGGTPAYNYTWSPSGSGPSLTGLAGGTYKLTVTDNSGCSATASATIINPQPIVISFNVKNALCNGDSNGAITTTVSGGFPNYNFQWSNGFTTQSITSLAGGNSPTGDTYILTVTDSHSCSVTDSATVFQPGALYTSGIIKNASCHNNCDGSVITTPYGGTVPYAFSWSNSETTENIVQLCGGNYTLTLTDANQCSVVSLYIVNNPPQLTLSIIKSDNSCFGSCNGSVVSIPGGGTPPYSYLWSNFSNDSLQNNVCAGLYTLQLTDSNGCRTTDTATVTQPAAISITGAVTDILCNGASTGAINTTITGGILPYTFTWSNSATTQNISGLDSNTYVITVADGNNCLQSASFNVTQPTAINSAVSLGKPLCHGGGNGFVSVAVSGGSAPYTYTWNTTPVQFGATAANLYAGNYGLTVVDNHGCSATVAATLPDPGAITISSTPIASKCFNSATGGVYASTTGGTPPYTYLVNGVLQNTDTFANLLPGNYTIVVIDANGCQGTSTFSVVAPPPFAVTLSVNPTDNGQYIVTGQNTQLIATTTPDTGIIHYFWSPDTLMQFTDCADPTNCSSPFAAPTSTTTFTVTVENSDSCFVSDTITIYVETQGLSFIPTAFTPNGDGLNDRFDFDVLGAQTVEVSIFDRWGERVYYNANQNNGMNNSNGWDGTDKGKAAPDGTYVYQMRITYFDGTVKNRAGTVALIR